jgi:CheY-like chemotaxis protein
MTIIHDNISCVTPRWPGQTSTMRCNSDGRGKLDRQPVSVLIIDDEEIVCRTLGRLLRRYADAVYTAPNKAEALRVLEDHPPVSILVCDFNLGENEPTGIALVESLRQRYSSIEHAVIYTGEGLQCLPWSKSVDNVMRKGTDEARLCELIRRRLAPSPLE